MAMHRTRKLWQFTLFLLLALASLGAGAQGFAEQKEGDWTAKDFRFHNGQVMPELRIHYTTLGSPSNPAVLILHGTTGTGSGMLNPNFGGQLFGPGQPLDASKYYVILPDAIGTGKTAKPSDGLRAKFPQYDYDDMVDAHHRLVTEGLGIKHLRLVLGNSMGGMHTWLWGVKYPDMMDALVPMASMPTEMSGRNWIMRRLIIDSIRKDPEWLEGNYTKQPRTFQLASVFYNFGTNGGNQGLFKAAPTREAADKLLDSRLNGPFAGDANDHLYQWDASRDYNPSPRLERIKATVLAINSADDERNPPELGVMEKELRRIPNAKLYLVPGSADTFGHGTTGNARFWRAQVEELLRTAPRR
jgi:homoserine O-acetyltransferase